MQIRRIHTRLHHGPVSRRVIALAAAGQHGMAATGQVRLAVAGTGPRKSLEQPAGLFQAWSSVAQKHGPAMPWSGGH